MKNAGVKILAFFIAFLLCVFVSFSEAKKKVYLNLNAIYGPTSIHTKGAMKFAELVKKYTDGTVIIKVYPGGSLGFKGPELLRAVRDGEVAMSDILMGVVSGSEHIFGVSSLPRIVKNYKEAWELYQALKPFYEKACLKWNQKFLYAAPWPPSGLVTAVPVTKTSDLKGLKIRTYDKNGAKFLRALGANAISMPWGEVYSALRTNLINGVLTSAESAKNGKFWEVLKYFTTIHYAYPLNMLTINLDYWNALTPEQQKAMLKAAKEVEKMQWEYSKKINSEAIEILKKHKMKILKPTKEFEKDMDKVAKEIVKEFLNKCSPEERKVLEKFLK